mgnify:CR=1 FL=1
MLALGLALLFVPLVLMAAMGAYYAVSNKLTRYHRAIARVVGEWALSKELLSLFLLNAAALLLLALTSPYLPRWEKIARLDLPTIFVATGALMAIGFVADLYEYSVGVFMKKVAGVSMMAIAWTIGVRLFIFRDMSPLPTDFWIASFLEVAVCLAVTVYSWRLGRRAKTETPWKVLAVMTAIGAVGLALLVFR